MLQINLAVRLENDSSYSNSCSASRTLPRQEIELSPDSYSSLYSSNVTPHVFCATFSLNIIQRRALGKEAFVAYFEVLSTFQSHSYLSKFKHFPRMKTRLLSSKMASLEDDYHQSNSSLVLIPMLTLCIPKASYRRAGRSIMTLFMVS